MKIRTDFVTNSSSSSFIVDITIILKNGDFFSLSMDGDEECGDKYRDVSVNDSELKADKYGNAESIESLIQLINQSIDYESIDCENYYDAYDKSGTPISENPDEQEFFDRLRSIEMKDIKKINIKQFMYYHDGDEWSHSQSYDCETGEFIYENYEEPREDEG